MPGGCLDDHDDSSACFFLGLLRLWELFCDALCTAIDEGIAGVIETLGVAWTCIDR